jgi:Domain of unknown function (DUF222)
MFGTLAPSEEAVAPLAAGVDRLLGLDLTGLSSEELLGVTAGLEAQRRRAVAVAHALVAELHTRGVAGELGCVSTGVLLARLLRIPVTDGNGRVAAAAELGPRRGLGGARLEPVLPVAAAAQAAGVLGQRHASVIRRTVAGLPAAAAGQADAVEAALTGQAGTLDWRQLAAVARRVADCLDPDGTLSNDADRQRRRHASLTVHPDGSGRLDAYLTADAVAVALAVLDPLSQPLPAAEDGQPDRRTSGQRRHDALRDAFTRLLRAGTLPQAGGVVATVAITIPLHLEARAGVLSTAHGGTLSVPAVLRLAAEADLIPVVLGDGGGVLAYGRTRRVASAGQRRADFRRQEAAPTSATAGPGGSALPAAASWPGMPLHVTAGSRTAP